MKDRVESERKRQMKDNGEIKIEKIQRKRERQINCKIGKRVRERKINLKLEKRETETQIDKQRCGDLATVDIIVAEADPVGAGGEEGGSTHKR